MTSAEASKHILVVEDSSVVRQMLTHIIQNEGYRVDGCHDGLEALELLRSDELPRLILLDLILPFMGADEFLQQKNSDPLLAEIPVAIISSYPREEANINLRGTVAYLQKPIELDALMQLVQRYCD